MSESKECKSKQGQYIKLRQLVDEINTKIAEAQQFASKYDLVFGQTYDKSYNVKKSMAQLEIDHPDAYAEWQHSNCVIGYEDVLEEYDLNEDWAPSQYC